MDGQIREVVRGDCAVCGMHKDISFYSESICKDCQVCPECGEPAYDALQTFPYICVVQGRKRCGVRCKKCHAEWDSRSDLDEAVLHQAKHAPASICKLCGDDAHARKDDLWKVPGNHVHLCKECTTCPVCGGYEFGENFTNGNIECAVCGEEFADTDELEQRVLLKSDRLQKDSHPR